MLVLLARFRFFQDCFITYPFRKNATLLNRKIKFRKIIFLLTTLIPGNRVIFGLHPQKFIPLNLISRIFYDNNIGKLIPPYRKNVVGKCDEFFGKVMKTFADEIFYRQPRRPGLDKQH